MRKVIHSQVPYITYEEALKPNRRLCPQRCNRLVDSTAPGSSCSHYAERLFHTKGVHNPTAGIYSNYHLAIWIPGTTLPWDVLLPEKYLVSGERHANPTKAQRPVQSLIAVCTALTGPDTIHHICLQMCPYRCYQHRFRPAHVE